MKFYRFSLFVMTMLLGALFVGCSDDEGVDYRDTEYGYVQFKLYKAASYGESRAVQSELDYLAEACKVKVTLAYGETTIAQTLNLTSADEQSAEYGLRSDKLKLLTGRYNVVTFELYDALDEPIYYGSDDVPEVEIVEGGVTQHDLKVNVAPRGRVTFSLVKDVDADFSETPTRARNREYTFDEIKSCTITVENKNTGSRTKFERLPMKFSIHFDENNAENGTPGYQTSSSRCDSLLSLPAGDYRIYSYEAFDSNKILLENNTRPKNSEFTVADNLTTEVKAKVTLYEADEYIKDGYALYEIWKALDGPNWYAAGETDVQGDNWNFNKDPDLWCDQPGVQVHTNGRVARISINDFGFRGHMPAAIGQLTELVELYLGTHNDNQGNVTITYDPSIDLKRSIAERKRSRMEDQKLYLDKIHPATQFSEPCARGLALKGVQIPATSLFDAGMTEDEIFDRTTGLQRNIRPMDMNHGKLTNGLKSLPKEIGNLKKLEYLYIANGELEELPDELALLPALTDFELYNCPKMTKFPMVLGQMPALVSMNISNNSQWSPEEVYKGMKALADGPAKELIQILYARQNRLQEIPAEFANMKKLGLLDLAYNEISVLYPLGREVAPVKLYLDHNQIESFPLNADGIFCGIDDTETISIQHNKLKEFPNIFNSKSKYVGGSVDVAYNQIEKFPENFKGINVETLTLACNPIKVFPKELADTDSQVSYIIMRGCEVEDIPEGSFSGKYSNYMMSFDLSYNHITDLPKDFTAEFLPYLYGLDLSYNSFAAFPWEPLNCSGLTILALRGQRNAEGERCLSEWPTGIYQHVGLRALYLGSNDLRKVDDTISYMIFYLDISDNPNITFDASDICYYWRAGAYNLIYDKTQNILGCSEMLE